MVQKCVTSFAGARILTHYANDNNNKSDVYDSCIWVPLSKLCEVFTKCVLIVLKYLQKFELNG